VALIVDRFFTCSSSRGVKIVTGAAQLMEITALHTIQSLADRIAIRNLSAGELLFQNEEPGNSIFAVLSGSVELCWPGGHHECLMPGQLFGIGALVEPDHRRHGSAQALEDSRVIELNREEFLFAIQESPVFALQVMAALEERMRRMRES
jgi:CRP/FNR family transcriptional regulator, cyclic AMP receptor protein